MKISFGEGLGNSGEVGEGFTEQVAFNMCLKGKKGFKSKDKDSLAHESHSDNICGMNARLRWKVEGTWPSR